jgi:hypothetical protein
MNKRTTLYKVARTCGCTSAWIFQRRLKVQNPACRGSVEGAGNQALDPIIQRNLTKTEAFLKVYWYSESTKICEKERTL